MRRPLAALLLVLPCTAASAQTTITPSAPGPWQFTASASALPAPPAAYVAPGFETPPLGIGSAHLAVGSDGSLAAQARNTAFTGTLLSDLTALSYSTYVDVDGSGGQAPFLNLLIDQDNNGSVDDQLFFEPQYQTGTYPGDPVPNQGTIQLYTWQTWDGLAGGWWSLDAGTFGPPLVTLATYVASFPNARIVNSSDGLGGLRIMAGSGAGAWDNFLGGTDNVTVDTTATSPVIYDFEPDAGTVVTVTVPTPDGWSLQTVDDGDADNTATIDIVAGPATPPLGVGSLELSVGADGGDAAQARSANWDGQLLRDLSSLSYWTYVQQDGSGGQAPFLMLDVDYDNNGARDDILFFEPVYQSAPFFPTNPQPALVPATWQQWDARSGGWWSLNGVAGSGPGVNVKPLGEILDVEPDARLTGSGVRIAAGFGAGVWDNFLGNADALSISFAGSATAYDFEPVPTLAILDLSQAEGTGGSTGFVFTLDLSHAVSQSVTVEYTTADGSATAADADYTPVPVAQMATFEPFATSTTLTITVAADAKLEPNEDFFVDLANPQFATLLDAQALGTILNDDAQPTVSIGDVSLAEGNAGMTPFTFQVTLSNPSSLPITISYATAPGTATAGVDYTSASASLVIPPGQTSGSITIDVLGDTGFEPDETFFVEVTGATNATIGDGQGLGTILNDDGPIADVTIAKTGPALVAAGDTITYTITVTNNGPQAASNVVVTDVLPAGTTFLSAAPSQGDCSGTATITCTLGALANGASATIVLTVQAPPDAATLSNSATVANTPEADPTPADNVSPPVVTGVGVVPAGIPTLSQWGLLALLATLMALGVARLR